MQLLTPEDFEPWVGRAVRVSTVPKPVEITLAGIERHPPLQKELDFREPFTLLFESPIEIYLLDDSYEFDCGKGGPHTIFISQRQPGQTRRYYHAVFG